MVGKLIRKKLGFRYVMDVISMDSSQVKGSHGLVIDHPDATPIFMTTQKPLVPAKTIAATDVCELILQHVFTE
jgi:hypothetical protein